MRNAWIPAHTRSFHLVLVALAAWLGVAALPQPASAEGIKDARTEIALAPMYAMPVAPAGPRIVVARVDLSDQTMAVYVDNRLTHRFMVSTGRGSYRTPTGTWHAQWLSPKHRSRKYDNAPMPWSVFFYKGYAVHGTTEVDRLGAPASHGCVRLAPNDAKTFYDLVKAIGKANTTISVVN